MSTIAVNTITDASGGNTAQINGITPTAYNTMGRNRIINGAMEIAQRNTSVTNVSTTGYLTVDRWAIYANYGSLTYDISQSSDAPVGFTKSLKFAYNSGTYSAGATNNVMGRYTSEMCYVNDFAYGTSSAKPITISLWVKAKRTGTFTINMMYDGSGTQRQISRQGVISAAETWEYFSFTIPGDTGNGFTSSYNGTGLYFDVISNANGGSTSGTLNTVWSNNVTANRAPGQTDFIQSSGDYFQFTGVQLEVGSVATEFERRPYGTELALCQRYYYQLTGVSGLNTAIGAGMMYTSTDSRCCVHFPQTMRDVPTVSFTGSGLLFERAGTSLGTLASLNATGRGKDAFVGYSGSGTSTGTQGQGTFWYFSGSGQSINISAEL